MIPPPIKSDERVFIDKIPRMEWGKNTENSFVRSAQLTIKAIEKVFSYPYLMGISGAAFKFQFHLDWCPSTADATTGFDVSGNLFKSAGFKAELLKIDDSKFSDIQKLYKKIIEHIDQGIPIIAINLKTCPEWGIITGYIKNKPGIICRTYFDEGEEYSMAEHAPWLSYFITGKNEMMDREAIFKNSIETAILLAKTVSFENYKSGFSAFESWINQLKSYSASKKSFEPYEINLTMLYVLADARLAAFKYLEDIANRFRLQHSHTVINNYQKEHSLLKKLIGKLPDFDDTVSAWNSEIINEQINVIEKALQIEQETIELLEDSLN